MLMLEIRRLNLDSMDMEDAVAALAVTKTVVAEYTVQEMPAPEWLTERLEQFTAEVKSKRRDYLSAQLKTAKIRLDRLKTPDQKRTETAAEIETLTAQLAKL